MEFLKSNSKCFGEPEALQVFQLAVKVNLPSVWKGWQWLWWHGNQRGPRDQCDQGHSISRQVCAPYESFGPAKQSRGQGNVSPNGLFGMQRSKLQTLVAQIGQLVDMDVAGLWSEQERALASILHLAGQEGLVGNMLRQGHAHADGQGQGPQQVARVLVVVLQPPAKQEGRALLDEAPQLAVLVAVLPLQDLAAGHIFGNGPAELGVGVPGVLPRPVLVDLVLGVVGGHDRRRFLEPGLVQALVARA